MIVFQCRAGPPGPEENSRGEAAPVRQQSSCDPFGLTPRQLIYSKGCCSALYEGHPTPPAHPESAQEIATNVSALRPGSSVVERGPEKAGVGGSIPSLATI